MPRSIASSSFSVAKSAIPPLGIAMLIAASSAFADSVAFDNGASALPLSGQYDSAHARGASYTASSTAGVGAGAGLSHAAADQALVYRPTSFDFTKSGGSYTVSMMMKSSDITAGYYMVGFSSASNQA